MADDFYSVIQRGEVNRARNMLQAGQDVNETTWTFRYHPQTPIAAALQRDENDMLELLLEYQANLNRVSASCGRTPLHLCASMPGCSASKVQLLLFHGAEVGSRDNNGSTPLHLAATFSFVDVAIAELLMANHADLNAVNRAGQTPLHYAACKMDGNEDVASVLINGGANLNAVDGMGWTPLHWACHSNNENMARLLIERGANLNAISNAGFRPICFADTRDHESVRLLLMDAHARQLLAIDNAHPGLWAQALATVGHKKTPGRLSLLFSLLQKKPDLFNYLPQEENPRKRKRSD